MNIWILILYHWLILAYHELDIYNLYNQYIIYLSNDLLVFGGPKLRFHGKTDALPVDGMICMDLLIFAI